MSKTKETTGGISAVAALGYGIYGIGKVHGFLNMSIFVIGASLALFLVYRFTGARKKKEDSIVYNLNESFILTVLGLIVSTGIYSSFRIYMSQNELGENVASYAIVIVCVFVIILPAIYGFLLLNNRNDKIIVTKNNLSITDNNKTYNLQFSDIESYQIKNSKLVIEQKGEDEISIKLEDLNLNSRDIKLLDNDLNTYIAKTKP